MTPLPPAAHDPGAHPPGTPVTALPAPAHSGAPTGDPLGDAASTPREAFRFLLRVPWEKLAIWAMFLSLIYVLRDFFTILFLTFVFSYMAQGAVGWMLGKLGHAGDLGVIRRRVVVAFFTLLLTGIIGLGWIVLPRFYDQANQFVRKLRATDFKAQVETGLRNALGAESFADLERTEWYKDQMTDLTRRSRELVPSLTGWVTQTVLGLLTLLLHFFLSLLFSFLFVFDIPKLRRGFALLEYGNFRKFYREIAPTVFTFGAVLGRAFQAQAAIAVLNTMLTFIGLMVLGIGSPVFLCAIVFLCSFIPVAGMFLSTVPICLMALQQSGFGLALEVLVLVLVIHAIEAYILNPKIVGDMMKMHPLIVLIILTVAEHFFKVWGLLLGVPVSYYVYRFVIQGEAATTAANAVLPVGPPGTPTTAPADSR